MNTLNHSIVGNFYLTCVWNIVKHIHFLINKVMHIALEWYQIIDTAIHFEDEHAICNRKTIVEGCI